MAVCVRACPTWRAAPTERVPARVCDPFLLPLQRHLPRAALLRQPAPERRLGAGGGHVAGAGRAAQSAAEALPAPAPSAAQPQLARPPGLAGRRRQAGRQPVAVTGARQETAAGRPARRTFHAGGTRGVRVRVECE